MRRTDEAFKTEVFRRYGVQKRNRRNYFLLALSPLVLATVLGSLLFLPQLSGLLNLTPAAAPPLADSTPTLADIDKLDIDKIVFNLPDEDSTHTVTDAEIIQTLTERMARIETKVTHKPQKAVRTPVTASISCDEYETLTIYLGKDHEYLRIDAKPKGADEIVTEWYRLFNLDRQILRKAFYTAAGITLVNTDHIEALLTSPVVKFSSGASGEITDPVLIADVMEVLLCLQLKPQSSGGLADVITEQITLTLQSGRTITCTIRGSLLDVAYKDEDNKTVSQTFSSADLEIFQKMLKEFKQPQPTVPTLEDFLISSAIDKMQLGAYYQSSFDIDFGGSAPETAAVLTLLRELDLTVPDPWSMNWNPETDIRLTMGSYTVSIGADPHTGWIVAYVYNGNSKPVSETYYYASPAKVKALVICVEELLYGESSLNKPPEKDPDEVLAEYLSGTIPSMGLSSFSVQSHTHACSPEEIRQIVAALQKLTKTKSEPLATRPAGAVVYFTVGEIWVNLTFDSFGYMELKCLSQNQAQVKLFQGYQVPANEVAAFSAIVNEIMYGTQAPPEPQYPMLEDLLTFLHPTANALYIYPKLASSIRYEYSGTGEEIAHVLTSLRDMAPTRLSDSFSTDVSGQLAVEWVLDEYSVVILLGPDGGFIRFHLISPDGEQLTTALYSAPAADVAALVAYLEGLTQPNEPTTNENPPAECKHDYKISKTQNATCIAEGSRVYTCQNCGDSYTERLAITSHDYKEATCVAPKTCTICHDTQGKALGHTYQNDVCITCGSIIASQGLEFALNADGKSYAVIGIGSCTDADLVIPNVYEGLPVTTIGNAAFDQCYHLTSVTIPKGVTVIEAYAFGGCYQITDLTIPDGVLTIGEHAFGSCQSLTAVVLPDSITSLGRAAFNDCINLTTINIPTELTKLEQSTFENCNSLLSIVIPDGITTIGSWAFDECTSLKSVTIPNSVRYIEYGAFQYCTSLEEIVLPKQLTTIHFNLFYKCTNLKSVYIPDGVTTIENGAFQSCVSLKTIKLPETLKEIGEYAFSNCKSLTNLTLPDSVKYIYKCAFAYCDSLTDVVLPDDVYILEYKAFAYCDNLKSVIIAGSLLKMGEHVFSNSTSLEVIYCETKQAHRQWETDWLGDCNAKVYWKDEWEYANGVPTAK